MTESEADLQPAVDAELAPIRPSDMLYAGLGYLGMLYESQLAFFKHQLEKPDLTDREQRLIEGLQTAHIIAVDLFTAFVEHGSTDGAGSSQNGSTSTTIRELANDGMKFMRQLQERYPTR